MHFPKKLQRKLNDRKAEGSLRELGQDRQKIDFYSNDYLGFARDKDIFDKTHQKLVERNIFLNGATGSRLLSGNHSLYYETEHWLANYHNTESALIFNSGYDANVGFFGAVPQRGDLIFYDELIHASIRDGLQMSHAKSYKFEHNNLEDLNRQIERNQTRNKSEDPEIYIVTESVFSMDGDSPDLKALAIFCAENGYNLIVDEAHAVGVYGKNGVGLIQQLVLEDQVFARIVTFGKALGCHGAAILGSKELKNYLINFARSFIYTTGLSPHTVATIQNAYSLLEHTTEIDILQQNIDFFKKELRENKLQSLFIPSDSAIHCCVIAGNEKVTKVAMQLQHSGFDVKAIRSPTVPRGKERLRFCLHSFNSEKEISEVLRLLATFVAD